MLASFSIVNSIAQREQKEELSLIVQQLFEEGKKKWILYFIVTFSVIFGVIIVIAQIFATEFLDILDGIHYADIALLFIFPAVCICTGIFFSVASLRITTLLLGSCSRKSVEIK
jgi:hypothetical protein